MKFEFPEINKISFETERIATLGDNEIPGVDLDPITSGDLA